MSPKAGQTVSKFLQLIARAGRKTFVDPGESLLILRMAGWVLFLSIAVKIQPLPRALSLVAARKQGASSGNDEQTGNNLARAIDLLLATDLMVFKPICWKRAAILHRYLALNGITSRIVFGVRKGSDGKVDGHAWLEADGKPLLESNPPDYNVTYVFPSLDQFEMELSLLKRGTR